MKKLTFIILFLLTKNLFLAAQATEQSSLLWKISGKNLRQPSYLFGTMHVQDERVFMAEDLAKEYISKCDAFAPEILLDEVNPADIQQHLMMKNTSLKDLLSPDEYHMVDEYLQEKMGLGLIFFHRMKPFFLAAQMMQLDLPADRDAAMDMDFLNYARSQGKIILSVEKLEDQIRAVDQIPLSAQAAMLLQMIENQKNDAGTMEKMLNAYIAQDIERLYDLTISDTTAYEHFHDIFLSKRNKKMTGSIRKIAKKHSAFFAVGAAHLGGPDGIIALLRKKGYNVEAVYAIPVHTED
jgi:uncharacterized protein YbaP (TraB family)